MTIVDDSKGPMVMEMSGEDMCRAVEYYVNNVMFKEPKFVRQVSKITHAGNLLFRIEMLPMPELDSLVHESKTPMVDSILEAGEDG